MSVTAAVVGRGDRAELPVPIAGGWGISVTAAVVGARAELPVPIAGGWGISVRFP